MQAAIRAARNSRGTNDAGNERSEFAPADSAHAACHIPSPATSTTMTTVVNEPSTYPPTTKSLLTVTIEGAANEELEKALDAHSCDQSCISLSHPEQLEQFFDDDIWTTALDKIKQLIINGSLFAGFFMHFGLTFNSSFRNDHYPYGIRSKDSSMNQQVRSETCLALRILQLITMFITALLPWTFIIPSSAGSSFSMADLSDYAEIKERYFIRTLSIAGNEYEVLSSQYLQESGSLDLDAHVTKMETAQYQQRHDQNNYARKRS